MVSSLEGACAKKVGTSHKAFGICNGFFPSTLSSSQTPLPARKKVEIWTTLTLLPERRFAAESLGKQSKFVGIKIYKLTFIIFYFSLSKINNKIDKSSIRLKPPCLFIRDKLYHYSTEIKSTIRGLWSEPKDLDIFLLIILMLSENNTWSI